MTLLGRLKKIWPILLTISIYLLIFLYQIYPYGDYDWGWHFRYGEYFVKTGHVLLKDPFSSTLPGYVWTNDSWLYDPILYLVQTKSGFTGLSILSGLIACFIFLISTVRYKLGYLKLGILAFFFIKISQGPLLGSLRAQSFGLLLLSVLMFLLMQSKEKVKTLYFLPLLFLLWANLHGTFTFGLLVLAMFLVSDLVNKNVSHFVLLLKMTVFSATLSFVNPFTYAAHLEALNHFSNSMLSSYITEWQPVAFCSSCNLPYVFYFWAFVAALFIIRRKLSDLSYILLLSFLAVEAFLHRRYLSMFIVAAIPIVASTVTEIKVKFEKSFTTLLAATCIAVFLLLQGLFVRLPRFNLPTYSLNDYCRFTSHCTGGLTDYLLKNPLQGRGLNFYDWGGYLIGIGVKFPLFIDGRMPTWNKNGYYPLVDYGAMYYEHNIALFTSYHFNWVIARVDAPILTDIRSDPTLLSQWNVVYADDDAVCLVRKEIPAQDF